MPDLTEPLPHGSLSRGPSLAAQSVALLLSLLWGIPGFGLIDLETAIPPGNPDFRTHWFLEGGWGLFITALVVVPLLVVALAPSRTHDTFKQLHVLGGCALVAGVLCLDASMLALAAGLVMTAWSVWAPIRSRVLAAPAEGDVAGWWPLAVVSGTYLGLPLLFGPDAFTGKVAGMLAGLLGLTGLLAYSPRVVVPGKTRRGPSWALVATALAGSGAWIGYAVSTAHAHWEGLRYVGTVERISAQTAFALALAALPLIAALGWLSIRLPVWTAGIAGAGFGAFAILYPDQLRSPGTAWGAAAIIWSVATIAVAEATLWRHNSRK